jgi:RNA polymerase subunit RPABC4/transcription elongation factor Spt4
MNCQNCGQINTQVSNFCRFCGTKFTQSQVYAKPQQFTPVNNFSNHNYEYAPPRPYSWKTDEFQISDSKPANKKFDHFQTFADFQPAQNAALQPYQQNQAITTSGYHCPRCSSQLFPRSVRQISTGGWMVFAIFLVAFFPLFWVGLLIKEETRVCPVCNHKFD